MGRPGPFCVTSRCVIISSTQFPFLTPPDYLFYLRNGVLSMVAFTILIFASIRPVRARAYEIFYFTHFSMALCVPLCSHLISR